MNDDKIKHLVEEWYAACADVSPTLDEKRRAISFIMGDMMRDTQDGMTEADSRLDHVTAFVINIAKIARGRLARYGNKPTPSR